MKNKIISILLFCCSISATAQIVVPPIDHSLDAPSEKRIMERPELGRFVLSAGGGLSWRIARIEGDLNQTAKAFNKDLKSGNNWDASLLYFFNRRFGFGLIANSSFTTARLDDIGVEVNGVAAFGDISEKINIDFYGVTFAGRAVNYERSGYFYYQASLGLLNYRDKFLWPKGEILLDGQTIGIMLSAGYAVRIQKNVSFGVGVNFLQGELPSYTQTINGIKQKINLPEDQYIGLTHFDFKAELIFSF